MHPSLHFPKIRDRLSLGGSTASLPGASMLGGLSVVLPKFHCGALLSLTWKRALQNVPGNELLRV